MKLSQLIEQANEILGAEGDLEVYTRQTANEDYFPYESERYWPIDGLSFEPAWEKVHDKETTFHPDYIGKDLTVLVIE